MQIPRRLIRHNSGYSNSVIDVYSKYEKIIMSEKKCEFLLRERKWRHCSAAVNFHLKEKDKRKSEM